MCDGARRTLHAERLSARSDCRETHKQNWEPNLVGLSHGFAASFRTCWRDWHHVFSYREELRIWRYDSARQAIGEAILWMRQAGTGALRSQVRILHRTLERTHRMS